MSDFSRFQPQGFYGGEDGKEKELGYDPKYDHTSHYAHVSSVLGITAIAANFFLPVVLPIALGSLSVLFAVFARGKRLKLSTEARRGVTFALTAIILNLILTVSSLYTTYESLQDPIRRAQISETLKQIYGISLEDAVSDFDAAFGTNLMEQFGMEKNSSDSSEENSSSEDSSSSDSSSTEEITPDGQEEAAPIPGTASFAFLPDGSFDEVEVLA